VLELREPYLSWTFLANLDFELETPALQACPDMAYPIRPGKEVLSPMLRCRPVHSGILARVTMVV
jgi:hypothetical protein